MPRSKGRSGAIASIEPDSLAQEAGLQPGDRVLRVNGEAPRDQLDYRFQTTDSFVSLDVIHDGEPGIVEFEKPIDEPLGIEFADDAFDGTRICNNTCFFCFLKGLPKGLRRPLYLKDDDYRLSFLHGNFVTLTNLSEDDWQRLEQQRLSPLHISVHATELELRRRMLGNRRAPDIREQLRRLAAMRIEAHTQVVLCPGVNDGEALDRTVSDLLQHENVLSIGVAPVGSSIQGEERIDDEGMRACTPAEARRAVRQLGRWQRRARDQHGASIVFPTDEIYLTAGARIPAAARYDGFPQWENGVGMVRTLLDDWRRARRRLREGRRRLREGRVQLPPNRPRRITLACGTLIAPILQTLAAEMSEWIDLEIDIVPVANSLFGARVNVSGLLPGADFAVALEGRELGERVFLPRASLDYFGKRFLDDMTPADLEAQIDRPVSFVYTLSEIVEWIANAEVGSSSAIPARSNGRSWTSAG